MAPEIPPKLSDTYRMSLPDLSVHKGSISRARQGWTCFGSDDLGPDHQTEWVDTWTPNGTETILQEDAGFPVAPGSLVLLQPAGHRWPRRRDRQVRSPAAPHRRHRRHQTAGNTGGAGSDRTTLRHRRIRPAVRPGHCRRRRRQTLRRRGRRSRRPTAATVQQCSNGKPIPGNTQTCDYPVPQPMKVYAGLGHMHAERIGPERCGWELRSRPRRTREMKR
jgi:hypothetical protein